MTPSPGHHKCRDPYFPVSVPLLPWTSGLDPCSTGANSQKVVCRLCYVLGVLRRRHGPDELHQASLLWTQDPLHCGLFWVYLAHPGLCYQGKSSYLRGLPSSINARKAPEHDTHVAGRAGPAGLLDLVPRQLLPHGLYWPPSCHFLWRTPSCLVDERLSRRTKILLSTSS